MKKLFLPLSMLLFVAVLILTFRWLSIDSKDAFIVDMPASRNYFALFSMPYEDKRDTEKLRSIAKDSISGVLVQKTGQIRDIEEKLELIKEGRTYESGISEALLELIDALPKERRNDLFEIISSVGLSLLDSKDYRESIDGLTEDSVWNKISPYKLPDGEANLCVQVLKEIMLPVITRDSSMAERLKTLISGAISSVPRELAPGDLIVSKGDIVSPNIADILRKQGYPEGKYPLRALILILLVFPFTFTWLYLCEMREESDEKISYLSFVLVMGLCSSYISALYGFAGFGVVPLAGMAYLTLDHVKARNLIVMGTLSIATVYSDMSSMVFGEILSMGLAAAILGSFFFGSIDSRSKLWLGVVQLGLGAGIVLIILRWTFFVEFDYALPLQFILISLLWATVTMITLFMAESFFDILSPLRLLEISQPDHPLQKRLQREAPGTYHHSQMVALLAESAAEDLGLNSRLVKAGAYFHDIGKLKRPQFFVENQFSKKNFHDDISPVMSSLVIISHVREGLELAEKYKLPARISNFIAEHHGTTCLNYFYRKAIKMGLDPYKGQFCYPGPIPSSKETGLVMLSDSVEAAVRAEKDNIKGIMDLREIMDSVIASKVDAGQMDNTGFTLRDIALIKESMLHNLQSMYHTRNVKPVDPEPVGDQSDNGKEGNKR